MSVTCHSCHAEIIAANNCPLCGTDLSGVQPRTKASFPVPPAPPPSQPTRATAGWGGYFILCALTVMIALTAAMQFWPQSTTSEANPPSEASLALGLQAPEGKPVLQCAPTIEEPPPTATPVEGKRETKPAEPILAPAEPKPAPVPLDKKEGPDLEALYWSGRTKSPEQAAPVKKDIDKEISRLLTEIRAKKPEQPQAKSGDSTGTAPVRTQARPAVRRSLIPPPTFPDHSSSRSFSDESGKKGEESGAPALFEPPKRISPAISVEEFRHLLNRKHYLRKVRAESFADVLRDPKMTVEGAYLVRLPISLMPNGLQPHYLIWSDQEGWQLKATTEKFACMSLESLRAARANGRVSYQDDEIAWLCHDPDRVHVRYGARGEYVIKLPDMEIGDGVWHVSRFLIYENRGGWRQSHESVLQP